MGKTEGNRQCGRASRRWEDNIKIDLRQIRWAYVELVDLAQDKDNCLAVMNTVMYIRVP